MREREREEKGKRLKIFKQLFFPLKGYNFTFTLLLAFHPPFKKLKKNKRAKRHPTTILHTIIKQSLNPEKKLSAAKGTKNNGKYYCLHMRLCFLWYCWCWHCWYYARMSYLPKTFLLFPCNKQNLHKYKGLSLRLLGIGLWFKTF